MKAYQLIEKLKRANPDSDILLAIKINKDYHAGDIVEAWLDTSKGTFAITELCGESNE